MLQAVVALGLASLGTLCAAPALTIERMAMHQYEDGPILEASYEFLPGETAHFSCRLSGYQIDKTNEEQQRVKLNWNVEVTDPAGVPLDKPKSGRIEAQVLPEDNAVVISGAIPGARGAIVIVRHAAKHRRTEEERAAAHA